MSNRSNQKSKSYYFQYTKPKFTLDKERNQIFIKGFGGVKKYFDSEDEYNAYVEKDRKKAQERMSENVRRGMGIKKDWYSGMGRGPNSKLSSRFGLSSKFGMHKSK